jgi:short-subunit dehydrogenase/MoaA/NifB/PqqE/SkfB family radical SAM enzyme
MEKYSFREKRVLITGASGGLGSALARTLADEGAHLVLSSRSEKAMKDLISLLPESTEAVAIPADLSKPGQAAFLAEKALAACGQIDVLINNAGVGYFALMEEAQEDRIRHLFELNTFSPMVLIQALLPHMKQRGTGRIINIVSAAGRVPIPTVGIYGGSKSALAVMTNTMRLELAPSGVDMLNIYPGTIDDSFEENALREEERPGLCPRDHCGIPRFDVARHILDAAVGPPGEVWLERQGKWLAATALIMPHYTDQKLMRVRDNLLSRKPIRERRWRLLQVESAISCNLRCVMCPWKEISKKADNRGLMTQEIWDAIRPYLPEVKSVDFTGGGEPLLQPNLMQWIKDASGAGCETGILTNGLLLNEKKSQQIVEAGIDWICFSMDGATKDLYEQIRVGSSFDRVCENIVRLNRLRKGNVPKTMINFVLMNINFHQVEQIVELAARLGISQVNFKQCDVIRGDLGKGFGLFASKETKEIRRLEKTLAKARRLAKKLGLHTTAFSFTPSEQPVCDQDPRDSMFIRYDGAVAPCINLAIGGPTTFLGKDVEMPVVHYGRLPQRDLMALWRTRTGRFYRERFENRVTTHEDRLVDTLVGASASREKALKDAVDAMPDPPEGCSICHYLYDV